MEVRMYVQQICYQLWAQLHQAVGPPDTIYCEYFDNIHRQAQLGMTTKSCFDCTSLVQMEMKYIPINNTSCANHHENILLSNVWKYLG